MDWKQVRQAYLEVADACELDTPTRTRPWTSAIDSHLLSRVMDGIDKKDRILDLGCCGYPWVTNYLEREGYDVVGVDLPKPHWETHNLEDKLGVTLIGYDGHKLPFDEKSFDLILMFGVLEHIGVWKSESSKYAEPNSSIWEHRREVLEECSRVLSSSGTLYITKFPNRYGRDKAHGGGHLNSERTRPQKLQEEMSRQFHVREFFANGILPHRIPMGTPHDSIPQFYARLDGIVSNLPIFNQVAQNYCIVATPS